MKPTISVIIPTYNERGNIIRLIEEIRNELKSHPHEILVVDDDSPDGTGDAVRKRFHGSSAVRCIIPKKRNGLGAAIHLGIRESRGTVIVGMDADGNHDPSLLPMLLTNLPEHTLRIASRYVPGGGMQPFWHYLASRFMNFLFGVILGGHVSDWTSGCAVIHRSDLFSLPLPSIYQGYGEYFMKLVYHARHKGFRIEEYPAFFPKRRSGKSKSKWLSMTATYLHTAWNLRNT